MRRSSGRHSDRPPPDEGLRQSNQLHEIHALVAKRDEDTGAYVLLQEFRDLKRAVQRIADAIAPEQARDRMPTSPGE